MAASELVHGTAGHHQSSKDFAKEHIESVHALKVVQSISTMHDPPGQVEKLFCLKAEFALGRKPQQKCALCSDR